MGEEKKRFKKLKEDNYFNTSTQVLEKTDQETQESLIFKNKFANDGSFLEMFKKMQEKSQGSSSSESREANQPNIVINNKRRNCKLKVGLIKRERHYSDEEDEEKLDPWSKYMKEVKKYKEKYGDDSDKNRPLVK